MPAHLDPLVVREGAGLEEYCVGDADLADIVERRGLVEEIDVVIAQFPGLLQLGRQDAHVVLGAHQVCPGLVVAGLREGCEREDGNVLGTLQLLGSRAQAVDHRVCVLGDDGKLVVGCHGHVSIHRAVIDRLESTDFVFEEQSEVARVGKDEIEHDDEEGEHDEAHLQKHHRPPTVFAHGLRERQRIGEVMADHHEGDRHHGQHEDGGEDGELSRQRKEPIAAIQAAAGTGEREYEFALGVQAEIDGDEYADQCGADQDGGQTALDEGKIVINRLKRRHTDTQHQKGAELDHELSYAVKGIDPLGVGRWTQSPK